MQTIQNAAQSQQCPFCNKSQNAGNSYCIYCGSRLGNRTHTDGPNLTNKRPQPTLAHEGTLFCPHCGGSNSEANEICGWCNRPLSANAPPALIVDASTGHVTPSAAASAAVQIPPIVRSAATTPRPVAAPVKAAVPAPLLRSPLAITILCAVVFGAVVALGLVKAFRPTETIEPVGVEIGERSGPGDISTLNNAAQAPVDPRLAESSEAANRSRTKSLQSAQAANQAAEEARAAARSAAAAQHDLEAARAVSPSGGDGVAAAQAKVAAATAQAQAAQLRADQARADAEAAEAENQQTLKELHDSEARARELEGQVEASAEPDSGLVARISNPEPGRKIAIQRNAGSTDLPVYFEVSVAGTVSDRSGNNVSSSYRPNLGRNIHQISKLAIEITNPAGALMQPRFDCPVSWDSTFSTVRQPHFDSDAGVAGTYRLRVYENLASTSPLAETTFDVG